MLGTICHVAKAAWAHLFIKPVVFRASSNFGDPARPQKLWSLAKSQNHHIGLEGSFRATKPGLSNLAREKTGTQQNPDRSIATESQHLCSRYCSPLSVLSQSLSHPGSVAWLVASAGCPAREAARTSPVKDSRPGSRCNACRLIAALTVAVGQDHQDDQDNQPPPS